jgi:hypothetical protein
MSLLLEVKLKGGLGNQLFQYATARGLCVKKKIPILLFNTDNYDVDPVGRTFALLNYNVKGSLIHGALTRKLFRRGTKYNRIISWLSVYGGIEELGLKLHNFPNRMRPFCSLNGYWQSDFYFREIRSLLLKEIVPLARPDFPDWQQEEANTVAVHVRRSDYLAENEFGILSEEYYRNSIDLARKRIADPLFIFFSDDLEWCKANFKSKDFLFCDQQEWHRDYLQLFLMSKCKHQIIANSSFSWWGAWLNDNPGKQIFRPERPFLKSSLQYESYYPADWIGVTN